MIIHEVPYQFLIKTNHEYPIGNKMVFEEFFYNKFITETPDTKIIYLPIQWTSFYLSRNCSDLNNLSDLQLFLNTLPRNKKFFTIIQYDDGIINDVNHIDLYKFASGGVGDYPVPLICIPYNRIEKKKDIFASFVGTIKGRHIIREKLSLYLSHLQNYVISECINFEFFKDVMERSIFSLCPRGYGKTSFRINESLNLGSIPVYIYDDPWIPFYDEIDFSKYGVLIHESNLHNIDNILKSYSQDQIDSLREYGKYVYKNYYEYESCYYKILNILDKKFI